MSGLSECIILASASPRRAELLEKEGIDFEIVISDVNEDEFGSEKMSPRQFAETLALAKAKDVARRFPDRLVLAADTVVDYQGIIIGKANNSDHAEEILEKLFSNPHKVITAVALVKNRDNLQIVECDTTIVYPKPMSPQQRKEYIESGAWQGKAGAYGIQEGGDKFVERIEGSFTNVMGLPVELVREMLKRAVSKQKYQ
ncbi:MAG: Maf family protein [Phycisphaerae bacterium]|nr:Maf family protein [Phycisphaerae bacterium]